MSVMDDNRVEWLRRSLRTVLVGPQLAAFLPAFMLGAYWFGGEAVLFSTAVIFPALMVLAGLMTQPPARPGERDPITGLPGRKKLIRQLGDTGNDAASADGTARICLVIGLDDFGRLAAHYGDTGTEAILCAVTERIRGARREGDFLAGLGHGRFGLALARTPRTDQDTMIRLSRRLQKALAPPIRLAGARVLVTASVGFALPSQVPQPTGEARLAAAESALDAARGSGPGSVRAFARGMHPRIEMPDDISREVAQALQTDQIRPWFQPQISTQTGALTGVEALARWHHPKKGMIAPGVFLPVIARAGLFGRLQEVILAHALRALREWDRAGLGVPTVAVNLSAEDLRDPTLVDRIRQDLDRFGLPPDRLTIEVLEDVVAQSEDDTAARTIAALSRLGCGIDLDDFGTGHASIANIRRFDVKRIKIDRSFVTHVDRDPDQQNMVAAILSMAERLALDTIGEGVESPGERTMLAQLGCRHVQGYSIARPMPFDEASRWIGTHQRNAEDAPRMPRRAG